MPATTRSTPKVSLATRAISTLELSPLVTAATAPACSMPASTSTSRSNPTPCSSVPPKSGGRRLNVSDRRSITTTECPSVESDRASEEPTRPQPTTITCTGAECRHAHRSPALPARRVVPIRGEARPSHLECPGDGVDRQAGAPRRAHRHGGGGPPQALQEG